MFCFPFENDEVPLDSSRICPPHRLPHRIPFGIKLDCESCHTHKSLFGRCHHNPFCKYILKCPHYEKMIEETNKYLNER